MDMDKIRTQNDLIIFYEENNAFTIQDKIKILSNKLHIWKYDVATYTNNTSDSKKLETLESILLRKM